MGRIFSFLATAFPGVFKWLLFDLVFGLVPIVMHAVVDGFNQEAWDHERLLKIATDVELALVAAVLMSSALGELLMLGSGVPIVLRLFLGFSLFIQVVCSSVYFAFVKCDKLEPLQPIWCMSIFGIVVLSGATTSAMAETAEAEV